MSIEFQLITRKVEIFNKLFNKKDFCRTKDLLH